MQQQSVKCLAHANAKHYVVKQCNQTSITTISYDSA